MCRKSRFVLVLFSFCSHTLVYTIFYLLKNSRPALLVFLCFSNNNKKFLIKCTQFFVVFFSVLSLFWCPPVWAWCILPPLFAFLVCPFPLVSLGGFSVSLGRFFLAVLKKPPFGGLGVAWRFLILAVNIKGFPVYGFLVFVPVIVG